MRPRPRAPRSRSKAAKPCSVPFGSREEPANEPLADPRRAAPGETGIPPPRPWADPDRAEARAVSLRLASRPKPLRSPFERRSGLAAVPPSRSASGPRPLGAPFRVAAKAEAFAVPLFPSRASGRFPRLSPVRLSLRARGRTLPSSHGSFVKSRLASAFANAGAASSAPCLRASFASVLGGATAIFRFGPGRPAWRVRFRVRRAFRPRPEAVSFCRVGEGAGGCG
jgi:hypothetical protein